MLFNLKAGAESPGWEEEALRLLESQGVDIVRQEGKAFVALEDYNALLRDMINRIISLTRAQNEEVLRVARSMEITQEYLSLNHPEVYVRIQEEINVQMRNN